MSHSPASSTGRPRSGSSRGRSAATRLYDPARPPSLLARTAWLIALILLGGIFLTGTGFLILLQREMTASMDSELRRGANSVLAVANSGDPASILDTDRQEVLGITPVDFLLVITDADGNKMASASRVTQNSNSTLSLPKENRAQVAARDGEAYTLIDSAGLPWRVLSVPSGQEDGPIVTVALPMSSTQKTLNAMALVIVIVGGAVVVIGTAAGGYLARRTLIPLRDVENTAKQIAGGDLSRRVPVSTSSNEARQLAIALNEMLAQIEISFQKQQDSEERATASEARMRRFVSDASHELRTPLAAIRGFGELYRIGALQKQEDVDSAMRRIEDEAQRMGSLVENLLRLARMDEDVELDLHPVDLTDAAFDAAQDLRALDPERTVMVCDLEGVPLAVAPHRPMVALGDEPSLRQVIMNLVGNVSRHTPKDTPVEIALGVVGDEVLVELRDHGEGIAMDQRDKIFERFYRTDSSRQRSAHSGGGAGLGLAIVAKIVAQHHGSIQVVETPGGGATFRVHLPAGSADDVEFQEPDQYRAIGGDHSPAPDATAPDTADASAPENSPDGAQPPPGAEPLGTEPLGTEPPGIEPPGTEPPSAVSPASDAPESPADGPADPSGGTGRAR